MDVIRHEAVGVQAACSGHEEPTQVEKIERAIVVSVEAGLPVVATMHDMQGDTRKHDARSSRHVQSTNRGSDSLTGKRGPSLI